MGRREGDESRLEEDVWGLDHVCHRNELRVVPGDAVSRTSLSRKAKEGAEDARPCWPARIEPIPSERGKGLSIERNSTRVSQSYRPQEDRLKRTVEVRVSVDADDLPTSVLAKLVGEQSGGSQASVADTQHQDGLVRAQDVVGDCRGHL